MATLRQWFEDFTRQTGEVPTHVVFGSVNKYSWDDSDEWPGILTPGKVQAFLSLPDATLDKRFDDGFGGNDSPDFCAWSENYVIFSDNYDGAESICWVPRHPIDHTPARPGGG